MNPPRSPQVDAYIAAARPFAQPILERIRGDVHAACPGAVETIKWGMPFFLHDGRILAFMAAFKAHAALGFGHGRQVIDLGLDGRAMGQFGRLGSVRDLPGRRALQALVRKAVDLIANDRRTPRSDRRAAARPAPVAPPELVDALRHNEAAQRFFASLAPSHQREYVEWIAGAKREATRDRRLATAVGWLAEGKRRNWRYERC